MFICLFGISIKNIRGFNLLPKTYNEDFVIYVYVCSNTLSSIYYFIATFYWYVCLSSRILVSYEKASVCIHLFNTFLLLHGNLCLLQDVRDALFCSSILPLNTG